VAKVQGTISVHGGLHPDYAEYGLDALNIQLRSDVFMSSEQMAKSPMLAPIGPLWYRGYGLDDEPAICEEVRKFLKLVGAKRMIMGHTVQASGRINTRCDGAIVLIDVGIYSFYGAHVGALDIRGDTLTAIYEGYHEELNSLEQSSWLITWWSRIL
jgi:hypothetical protein